jgi:hypothetical protein
MEEDEALATLLQGARRELLLSTEELESTHTLMKELGYLALALVQAGGYYHQLFSSPRGVLKPFTFTQYLSLFYSYRAELMKKSQPSSLDSYELGGLHHTRLFIPGTLTGAAGIPPLHSLFPSFRHPPSGISYISDEGLY